MGRDKTAAKAKSASHGPRRAGRARKAIDVERLREEIRDLVSNNALAMVETAIEEVDKGHYLAMKYLFEMIGLFPENAAEAEESPQEDTLARTLLRRLQLPEEDAGTEAVNVQPSAAEMTASDPVK